MADRPGTSPRPEGNPADPPVVLHVAYPNRWGTGKTHISAGSYRDTLCTPWLHGHRETGHLSDVTCKKCLKAVGYGSPSRR